MSATVLGALLGLSTAAGVWVVVAYALSRRRPALADRVDPYLRDLPEAPRMATEPAPSSRPTAVGWAIFGPSVRRIAGGVERVLGGGATIRRQLDRVGSALTLEQFRVQQALWGLGAFAATAGIGVLWSVRTAVSPLALLLLCAIAFAAGVVARDQALGRSVRHRERRMVEEFPTVTDLLALSVAAGEGPVAALERCVAVSQGELSDELRRVLAEIHTGTRISRALDDLSARTGVPSVARFAEALAVAIDRGTPLVDVLHAQAADVREASRHAMIEDGARREVAMMAPVVFLILPVTVLFAFFPGLVVLQLTSP
ncbi:type II secretion system F family protein [Solicola gregarius]|uniref:Type II secretion system F family protein n=1 Tax=Solicola gregarius TaxID=2908642 RepID=A0AA46TGE4_9ACTN|nr:type II secretion system F family protein [Solicola gregarius]UYM04073.1 type II secretion system F family protein [Solicola gregarius]